MDRNEIHGETTIMEEEGGMGAKRKRQNSHKTQQGRVDRHEKCRVYVYLQNDTNEAVRDVSGERVE